MTLLRLGRLDIWTYRRGLFDAGRYYWRGRTWGCYALILRFPGFNIEFSWVDADQVLS